MNIALRYVTCKKELSVLEPFDYKHRFRILQLLLSIAYYYVT